MSESPCVQSVCRAVGIPWYVKMVCAGADIQSSESMEAYKSQEVFLQMKRTNTN